MVEDRTSRWFRARHCLLLALLGWACSALALVPADAVQQRLRQCLDSPGAPRYAMVLAVAGLALNATATAWAAAQLAVVLRRDHRRVSTGHALLAVLLPLAALAVVAQLLVLTAVHGELGPHPSPCFGAAPPTPPAG
ncbi:hypothetical protein ACFV1L_07660 [Kitasatospora sp. NPDC059646]|uniref:hypothetical protein n=1 Tax=Kitasatospora sp. NPDC059646 TaxID=3346893 RepID=UPI0036B92549